MDVAEALLHIKNGAWFLCLLVANVPDSFNEGTVDPENMQLSTVLAGGTVTVAICQVHLLFSSWQGS